MKTKHKVVCLALGALVAAVAFGACSDNYPTLSGLAPEKEFFTATLTGAAERPSPITTSASGSAEITILNNDIVRVETMVASIDSVTQAHIHAGTADEAGPVMVFLFRPAAGVAATRAGVTGVLTVVDITRGVTAFTSPFTFDDLLTRVRDGTAYVNVHTRRNPGGEIRGQIVPE
jgi:hypothetical protein